MKSFKTEAVILKSKNHGEADRIITIFTKNYGKLVTIAKGSRRINSRKGPNLEIFNKVTLLLSPGKNFEIISEAELINNFENLRKNLKLIGLAYNVCELVDKLTPEHQESENIYNLLESTLYKLSMPLHDKNIILNFKKNLLEELGYLGKNKKTNIDLDEFIESIIEHSLKSRQFLLKI